MFSFGPLFLIFLIIKNKHKSQIYINDLIIFLSLLSVLLIFIAFIGGPNITGKNLTRLSNYSYLNLIILFLYFLKI